MLRETRKIVEHQKRNTNYVLSTSNRANVLGDTHGNAHNVLQALATGMKPKLAHSMNQGGNPARQMCMSLKETM